MIILIKAFALLLLSLLLGTPSANKICFEGYVMDKYCIDLGTLLDNPDVGTLENPEKHSVHCLVDVERCFESGFEVLQDPQEGSASKQYCRALTLDAKGNELALKLGRETGDKGAGCKTCTGTGTLGKGFRATVVGTIDPNDKTSPPLLTTELVLPAGVGCANHSGTKVFSTSECTFGASNSFIIAHGSLMVSSWGFLLPSGVLIAHFLRHRDPLWFRLHRLIQVTGICCALAGFIIAVTQFNVFGPENPARAQAHGYMGCIVTVLGLLQPINAYFRPHVKKGEPKTPNRKKWELCHRGSGWLAVTLAVPTICLGTTLAGLVEVPFQITYGVLAFFLVVAIALLYHDRKLSGLDVSDTAAVSEVGEAVSPKISLVNNGRSR